MSTIILEPHLFRDLRVARGFSQRELATRTKLSRTTVRKAESGHKVSVGSARRLADALGVCVSELITPQASDLHEKLLADLRAYVLQFEHSDNGNVDSRIANTVVALERVLNIGILNDKAGLCCRSELAVVLAILLSRVSSLYGQNTEGMSTARYNVLVIDAVAATAKALVQGVYENYHFNLLANTVHPSRHNEKPEGIIST